MEKFCIWIVSPDGYEHSHAFDELALALHESFQTLGFDAPIIYDPKKIIGRPLVLGANLIPSNPSISVPRGAILYNTEQVTLRSTWFNVKYLNLLKQFHVWDYSSANIYELRKLGVPKITYCGIGYSPSLTKIDHVQERDIDVLLYGSINDRRKNIIDALQQLGLNAGTLFNSYGKERDSFIARSKIVINIHYYETKVFEIVRVSYLLANKIFVISENGMDSVLEDPYKDGIVFAPYEKLVEECLNYLSKEKLRTEIAERGFQLFEKMSQSMMLEKAIKSL